jgi:hypothetical protein
LAAPFARCDPVLVAALTYTPILAHLGHWYVSGPIFLGPVVVIAIVAKISDRRARRRVREGDTSRLRVVVTERDDGTTLTAQGALNYITLLDIEHELAAAVGRDLPVLIDLRQGQSVDEDFAWTLIEAIRSAEGADITVAVGSAETLAEVSKVCALEGVKITDTVGALPSSGSDRTAEPPG